MPPEDLRAARETEMRAWYDAEVYRFRMFERAFAAHLGRALRNAYLDEAKLETRTKTVDSFVAKALTAGRDADFKYADPRTEVTDFVGARILVPLSTDVAPVTRLLDESYRVEEMSVLRADQEEDVPGYQSLHILLRLRDADAADVEFRDLGDPVVEIQVRTILQHAWAALQHDLMYKAERPPTASVRRRLISLAGLLELADREFVAVRQAHGEGAPTVEPIDSDRPVGPVGVREAVEAVFGEEDDTGDAWFAELASVLGELGVASVDDARSRLGPWGDRAAEVASIVRITRPWAGTAYLFDLLLRLALDEDYLPARLGSAPSPDARAAFAAERDELLKALEAH